MLLKSNIHNNQYAWVRIPKTATRAYAKLLLPEQDRLPHTHSSYSKIIENNNLDYTIPCLTVSRNPHSRFISMMKHFCFRLDLETPLFQYKKYSLAIPLENTTDFCNFFYTHYEKNCIPKDRLTHLKIAHYGVFNLYSAFLKTQTSFIQGAENPIIFNYENLGEFNTWLETEIGTDTSQLEHIGKIETPFPFNIDLQSDEVRTLVKYLFEEDYVRFNYV